MSGREKKRGGSDEMGQQEQANEGRAREGKRKEEDFFFLSFWFPSHAFSAPMLHGSSGMMDRDEKKIRKRKRRK